MQPPGRERVAEQFAGDLGRDDDRDQDGGGEPEVAGRFSAMNDIVSGPPITEADSALMPMIA